MHGQFAHRADHIASFCHFSPIIIEERSSLIRSCRTQSEPIGMVVGKVKEMHGKGVLMEGKEKGYSAHKKTIGGNARRECEQHSEGIGQKIEPIARTASRQRGLQHFDQPTEQHRPAHGEQK